MTSNRKIAAARANGAKSTGPKTPETREISSRNSLRHGFTARKTIVLKCEDPEEFQETIDHHLLMYQPATPAEEDLVNEMIACRWRMQRLRTIETSMIDSEMKAAILQGPECTNPSRDSNGADP